MSQINIKCIFKLELNYILIKEITYLSVDGDQILPSETFNKWSFTNFKIKLNHYLPAEDNIFEISSYNNDELIINETTYSIIDSSDINIINSFFKSNNTIDELLNSILVDFCNWLNNDMRTNK